MTCARSKLSADSVVLMGPVNSALTLFLCQMPPYLCLASRRVSHQFCDLTFPDASAEQFINAE